MLKIKDASVRKINMSERALLFFFYENRYRKIGKVISHYLDLHIFLRITH